MNWIYCSGAKKQEKSSSKMDIFAHALWVYILFNKQKNKLLAILFGVLPDLLSFGPFFLINLFSEETVFNKPHLANIPPYVYASYNITHSLIIAFAVILLVYIITKKLHLFLLAWPLHISIDIFSHSEEFFPTPFLYPISSFHIGLISWGNPIFMLINYVLIFSCLIYIIWKKKHSKS